MSPLVVLFRVVSLVVSLTTAKNGLPSNEPRYQARGSRVRAPNSSPGGTDRGTSQQPSTSWPGATPHSSHSEGGHCPLRLSGPAPAPTVHLSEVGVPTPEWTFHSVELGRPALALE